MHPRCYLDWLEAQERSARRWRLAEHVFFTGLGVASALGLLYLLWRGMP